MKFSSVPSATRAASPCAAAPTQTPPPCHSHRYSARAPLDAMLHRASLIFFAIHQPRQPRNGLARHQFANKHHAAPDFLALAPPHIKTQIHFVEITVEGNCQESIKLGAQKLKSHEAYKRPASKRIQLDATRNVLPQNPRLNFVVQHHQVAPLRRQKDPALPHQYPTVKRCPRK